MRKPVIKFFTDQTIFWNPGDAFNTAEELRNPAIVKAFRRIGMSDQAGTGIRSIFRNWHDLGNVPPELHNDKTKKTFELILRKEILLTPEQKAFQQSIGISLSAQEASVLAYATEQWPRIANRPSRPDSLHARPSKSLSHASGTTDLVGRACWKPFRTGSAYEKTL